MVPSMPGHGQGAAAAPALRRLSLQQPVLPTAQGAAAVPTPRRHSLQQPALLSARKSVACMPLRPESFDEVGQLVEDLQGSLRQLEKAQGLAHVNGGMMRIRRAEVQMLEQIEVARDLMQEALACSRETLYELFWCDSPREEAYTAKILAVLDTVRLSAMTRGDQRIAGCRSACRSVECVLRDAEKGRACRAARMRRLLAAEQRRRKLAGLGSPSAAERAPAEYQLAGEAQAQRCAADGHLATEAEQVATREAGESPAECQLAGEAQARRCAADGHAAAEAEQAAPREGAERLDAGSADTSEPRGAGTAGAGPDGEADTAGADPGREADTADADADSDRLAEQDDPCERPFDDLDLDLLFAHAEDSVMTTNKRQCGWGYSACNTQ